MHAVLGVERYVVDDNGLRMLPGADTAGPKGLWWNGVERGATDHQLSPAADESMSRAETSTSGAVRGDAGLPAVTEDTPLLLENEGETQSEGQTQTWDRFAAGSILASAEELNLPPRPTTPPNLMRDVVENLSAAGYQVRRVAELTMPQLTQSVGMSDSRYAARAKSNAGMAVVDDKVRRCRFTV